LEGQITDKFCVFEEFEFYEYLKSLHAQGTKRYFEKCHVTQGGAGGVWTMAPNVTRGEGGGSKKCQKSVMYYLNGPK
jgi:hypothetical protein